MGRRLGPASAKPAPYLSAMMKQASEAMPLRVRTWFQAVHSVR
jgi:hypothetical protein